jgi:hypothetical protein
MDSATLMVVVGLAAAVIGGFFVARQSNEFEAVRGGVVAQVLHYIASAGMAGIPAALLVMLVVTIFTPDNLFDDFVKYAIVNVAVVFGALLIYAVFEPDPEVQESTLPPLD